MGSRIVASLAATALVAACTVVESGARTADRAIGNAVGWVTGSRRGAEAEPLLGPPSPPPTLVPASGTFRTRGAVRLRVGPGVRYRTVAVLAADSRVVVLGRVKDRDWLRVRTAAGEGYVARSLLEPLTAGSGEDRLPTSIDSGG